MTCKWSKRVLLLLLVTVLASDVHAQNWNFQRLKKMAQDDPERFQSLKSRFQNRMKSGKAKANEPANTQDAPQVVSKPQSTVQATKPAMEKQAEAVQVPNGGTITRREFEQRFAKRFGLFNRNKMPASAMPASVEKPQSMAEQIATNPVGSSPDIQSAPTQSEMSMPEEKIEEAQETVVPVEEIVNNQGTPTETVEVVVEPESVVETEDNTTLPDVPASIRRDALAKHNKYRARHGVPNLSWSNEIERNAQEWADKCVFKHGNRNERKGWGENLGIGYQSMNEFIDGLYSEINNYNYNNPGFAMDTGHFTQIVWKGTKRLGCALGRGCDSKLWVCQYDPAGNSGNYAENVPRPV